MDNASVETPQTINDAASEATGTAWRLSKGMPPQRADPMNAAIFSIEEEKTTLVCSNWVC